MVSCLALKALNSDEAAAGIFFPNLAQSTAFWATLLPAITTKKLCIFQVQHTPRLGFENEFTGRKHRSIRKYKNTFSDHTH